MRKSAGVLKGPSTGGKEAIKIGGEDYIEKVSPPPTRFLPSFVASQRGLQFLGNNIHTTLGRDPILLKSVIVPTCVVLTVLRALSPCGYITGKTAGETMKDASITSAV